MVNIYSDNFTGTTTKQEIHNKKLKRKMKKYIKHSILKQTLTPNTNIIIIGKIKEKHANGIMKNATAIYIEKLPTNKATERTKYLKQQLKSLDKKTYCIVNIYLYSIVKLYLENNEDFYQPKSTAEIIQLILND